MISTAGICGIENVQIDAQGDVVDKSMALARKRKLEVKPLAIPRWVKRLDEEAAKKIPLQENSVWSQNPIQNLPSNPALIF